MKMILPLMILPLLFSGCATKRYVNQQCWETRRQAMEYTLDQNIECLQYTADVDARIDRIMRKSDIGRVASEKAQQETGIDWDQFEKDCNEAIFHLSTLHPTPATRTGGAQ